MMFESDQTFVDIEAMPQTVRLYIDDIRTPPDGTWTLCRDNLAAIKTLDQFGAGVMEISLDHDISHPIESSTSGETCSCAETFEVSARYIALMKRLEPNWHPNIVIHTSNPLGAAAMEAVLLAVDLRPSIRLEPAAKRG